MKLRNDQWLLTGAGAASLALWTVPALQVFLLPLIYLNTHVHEFCHALAALATGGGVGRVVVRADSSGFAEITGGWILVIGSAGYVGSTLIGGAILLGARNALSARKTFLVFAGLFAVLCILFLRGDLVGLLTAAGWLTAFLLAARYLEGRARVFAAQFVGLQLCLASLHALLSLLFLSAQTEAHTDARILEQATRIPALAWATMWAGLSVVVMVGCLRSAWGGKGRQSPTTGL